MSKNENLLVTLMEECAELQQAVSKILRFGADNYNPARSKRTNEYEAMLEYYQLVAVMEMLQAQGVLHPFSGADEQLVKDSKKKKVSHYQTVSKDVGCIK